LGLCVKTHGRLKASLEFKASLGTLNVIQPVDNLSQVLSPMPQWKTF